MKKIKVCSSGFKSYDIINTMKVLSLAFSDVRLFYLWDNTLHLQGVGAAMNIEDKR